MDYDQLLDIMVELVPDDFYYDAWGSQFLPIGTDENLTNYNYVGGVPLVREDHDWPTCEEHGPAPPLLVNTRHQDEGNRAMLRFVQKFESGADQRRWTTDCSGESEQLWTS